MRSKKALLNTATGVLYEVITIICGLILPRLVLSHFGSEYNGITSSISQFLSAIALMKAGIGVVTRTALYKPLAGWDTEQISSIVKTTERFMRRIACIFLGLVIVFACLYPFMVTEDFEWFFSFSLILILSISTFAQYFWGLTYQMLLQADQRQCVIYLVQICTTVLNTIIASGLIVSGCTIHVVKLASAVVFLANPLVINAYARRKYQINNKAKPDNNLIRQRWDAFGQQVAFFVHGNTDLVVLTMFSNLYEVSVYTVYNYALRAIRQVVVMAVTGFDAAFGNMYAKKETTLLEKNLKIYELIVFSLVSVIYTVAAVMIVPYALLYTVGIYDVDYNRPLFAAIMVAAGAFSCFRIPYKTIADVVGHFKQTRNGALIEAGLNIVISVLGVIWFGLIGVAFGTLVATVFRSVQYAVYISRNIIHRSLWHFVKHVMLCCLTAVTVYVFAEYFIIRQMEITVVSWILAAVVVALIAIVMTVVVNLFFYREEFFALFQKMKNALCKRNKREAL